MRIILLLLLAVGLIAGFLPRPLITPDWRTPYEKALAEEDCDALKRSLAIQIITNHLPAWFEINDALEQREICGAKRNPETNYEFNEEHMHKPWGLIDRSKASSFLGLRTQNFLRRAKRSKNPIIRDAQNRITSNYYICHAQLNFTSGYPNFQLMAYALKHEDVSEDEINLIALNQTAACARMMLTESIVMLNAANTPDDYETALSYGAYYSPYRNAAPEIAAELTELASNLPDNIKKANDWDLDFILDNHRYTYLRDEIGCANHFEVTLKSASECAVIAANKIAQTPEAAVFAVYYALRAKRLGWMDVANAEIAGRKALTPECQIAVAAQETEDTADRLDARNYDRIVHPIDLHHQQDCAYLFQETGD